MASEMDSSYKAFLTNLRSKGWEIKLQACPSTCPESVRQRYNWVPEKVWNFIEETASVVSPDVTAYFNASDEFSGESNAAYAWDQWELSSLYAAGNDDQWKREITTFWDKHFPIVMSVKDCYAFFAIRKGDLRIVLGEEPVYEDTVEIATTIEDFLERITNCDSSLARWITFTKL